MKKNITALVLLSLLTLSANAATYEIDGSHSSVGFKIRHLTISNVLGKFTDFKGTFNFDSEKLATSSTEATIAIKSIDTNDKKRDDHLMSDDFFNASTFGEMKFKSNKVIAVDKSKFQVLGDLTIRNVTKPVILDVEFLGEVKDPYGNQKAGFVATTKINRQDYGLKWSKLLEAGGLVVGDEVNVTIEVEGKKV